MNRFIVVKSLTRRYGYAIQVPPGNTWVTGPGNTIGWYRLKSDALKRAEELNRAFC
jgi:hypothetical protein